MKLLANSDSERTLSARIHSNCDNTTKTYNTNTMKFFLPSFLLLFLPGLPSAAPNGGFFKPVADDAVWVWENETTEDAVPPAFAAGPCNGVKDICDLAKSNDSRYEDLKQACNLLYALDYFSSNTLNSVREFTVFLPTNQALNRLWGEIYGYTTNQSIPLLKIKSVMQNHIIKDQKFDGTDIICKARLGVLNRGAPRPKVECKSDILGNTVAYIKGNGNKNKDTIPRIRDPSNPIVTCKDNIFIVEDVILYETPP